VLAAWRAGDADCVTLSRDGEGGTYFLHGPRDGGDGDSGAGGSDAPYVACFKPRDEEAGAPANPKRLQGAFGMPQARMGVLSGESWAREVAAFLLDHGIAGVPATGAVEARHPAFHYVPTSPTLGPLAPVDSRSASPRLATKLGSWQVRGRPTKPRSACPPSQRARMMHHVNAPCWTARLTGGPRCGHSDCIPHPHPPLCNRWFEPPISPPPPLSTIQRCSR
jgi:hypothetical protein